MPESFVLVVPVKPPARGKSRLGHLGDDERRRRLATAFALDTVTAALDARRVERVLVVGDDHVLARDLLALGAEVLPDGVADDLNETLRLAAREAERRWPGLRPAAVTADLPAVRAADLDAALGEAEEHGIAFVPDAAGTGTVLFTARGAGFLPRFGPGSARAHGEAGGVAVGEALVRLRRDVDDTDDLAEAMGLGLGAHTARALL